jgi:hypothetical protein
MAALLDLVIGRYGGMSLWRSCDQLTATISAGGPVFASRFSFVGRQRRRVIVSTKTPRTVFEDYPRPGRLGIFTPDRVWIESESGEHIAEQQSPRAAFGSLRRHVWWDHLDFLYFAGYATWNYLTTPFLLARTGVHTFEIDPWMEHGESWRRLEVHFPEDIPTHSSSQVFYFDTDLRLRRCDYDPEVYASWARAAHYCSGYETFSGLLIPTRRKVLARRPDNTSLSWPALLRITIGDVSLR